MTGTIQHTYMLTLRGVLCAVLIIPLCAGNQASSDWNRVRSVDLGARLRLDLGARKTVRGTVVKVSDTDVALLIGGSERRFARTEVVRAYKILQKKRRGRATLGALVGAGIGAGVGGYYYSQGDFGGGFIAGMSVVGAGIGALIGRFAGGRTMEIPLYDVYANPAPQQQ